MQKQRVRCHWLDIAKGIAIILVVFGHVLSSYSNTGLLAKQGYLKFIANFFSCFRMPFFFFASGLAFAMRSDRAAPLARQLGRRFLACFIPYLACTVVLWALKVWVEPLVNNQVGDLSIAGLMFYPLGYLWFLYALLLTQLCTVLLERARVPQGAILLLAVVLMVFAKEIAALPGLGGSVVADVARMYFFFAFGLCFQKRVFRAMEGVKPWYALAGLALLLGLSALRWVKPEGESMFYRLTLLLALAMSGIFTLCSVSALAGRSRRLEFLGENTMPVYLIHCVVVAGVRYVLTDIIALPLGTGWLHMMICLAAGTLLPLAIYWPISRVKWLDFWFYPMRYIKLGGKTNGRAAGTTGA